MNKFFFTKISFFLLFSIPCGVFASTLSGGSFVVNGSFTSIDSSATGGNFIVNNSGDAINTNNSSGGSFVVSPAFAPIAGATSTPPPSGGGNTGSGSYPYIVSNNINGMGTTITPPNNIINNLGVSSILEKIFSDNDASCDKYIVVTKPISVGLDNDVYRVKKIETFLNEYEKTSLPVDGFYSIDDKNEIEKFQNKYTKEILAPWGYIHATGTVYITTAEKMNSIVCATVNHVEIPNTKTSLSEKEKILEQKVGQVLDRTLYKFTHLSLWERIKIFVKNIFYR